MAFMIRELLDRSIAPGSAVTINGWIRNARHSKAGLSFLVVHDGSAFATIQVVVPNTVPGYEASILHLTTGCSVSVSGTVVVAENNADLVEVKADEVQVLGLVEDPQSYPVPAKRHTFEYLRTVAHLRPRTNTFSAVTRIRTRLANAIHNFFFERDFHWINTPIITASDCEGAGELFRVSTLDLVNLPRDTPPSFQDDFFGAESFLTVSGQLNVEAYCCAMSRVYTFGPTFRAENSNTSRHLAEFWMVEPEIAFADLGDNAALAEALLRHLFKVLLEDCSAELAFFDKPDKGRAGGVVARLESVADSEFERLDYGEAIRILESAKRKFEFPVAWGVDLQSEHERYLTEEHVGRPVVVMNYPRGIKAFYMRMNDDGETVAAMDVLAPGIGEIIGGSQREERVDVLDARMAEFGLDGQLSWYRDLRRYGTVPHAGFGLGFERLLNYVTGMENIRDVIPFPRTPGSAPF
tara:strand:- start:625 stop:2022 length:1398 start_codon:yes stop_codon:yes gene_type:complete